MAGFVGVPVPSSRRGAVIRLCDLEYVSKAAKLRKRGLASDALELLESKGARKTSSTRVLNELVLAVAGTSGFNAALSTADSSRASRNAVTYNVLIGAARRLPPHEALHRALALYSRMIQDEIVPSPLSLSQLFQLCSKTRSGDTAYEIWRTAIKAGSEIDLIAYSALVNCFAKSAQADRAELAYKEMMDKGLRPNERTYSSLMDAFSKAGQPRRTLEIFRSLQKNASTNLDYVSYCIAFHSHALLGDVAGALETKESLISSEIPVTQVIYKCILDACCKACDMDTAVAIVKEMGTRRIEFEEVDAISLIGACGTCRCDDGALEIIQLFKGDEQALRNLYNNLVASYALSGGPASALRAFNAMEKAGIKPDIEAYNILVRQLCGKGEIEQAQRVVDAAIGSGIVANMESFNMIIDAASRKGKMQLIIAAVKKMDAVGLKPNDRTWRAVFNGLLGAGNTQRALDLATRQTCLKNKTSFNLLLSKCTSADDAIKVIKVMKSFDMRLDADALSALLNVISRAGSDGAERLGKFLSEQSSDSDGTIVGSLLAAQRKGSPAVSRIAQEEVDSSSYNRLLSKLCSSKKLDEAVALMDEMRSGGLEVDEVAYTSIVAALGSTGQLDRAFRVLAAMEERNCGRGDLGAYAAIISACGRLGQFDRASEVFNRVQKLGLKPTVVMYNALLYSTGMGRQPSRAFSLYRDIQDAGLEPDAVTLSAMASVCLRNRIFDKEAKLLLKRMDRLVDNESNRKVRLKAKRMRTMIEQQESGQGR
ncbi:hypothetical protein NDN08_003777 [Rhodosorus marinus]|uniref:PROP1-like PPR domain-containing protein n=1 Tax=Rhodosorus marinus TaxID=101924 RepID=A0AAV8UKG7_9RHOD|nr:hypothetical protein NDN08_003777 [Rhodosorus marinus]